MEPTEKLPESENRENPLAVLNWETFWSENESEIEETLKKALGRFWDTAPDYYTQELREEKLREKLGVEREFSKVILETLKNLLERNQKVLMLFDIDETIGKAFYDEKNAIHTVIRPAFLLMMNKLQELRQQGVVGVGLLTTRGIPREQLEDPENLQPIKEFIHTDHIYSTREIEFGFRERGEQQILEEILADPLSAVKPGILRDKAAVMGHSGALKKVILLQRIKSEHPDMTIMAVDDDSYPAFLDEDKGFKGIQLGRGLMFGVR